MTNLDQTQLRDHHMSVYADQLNDYSQAGPGAKRRVRERLTIETVNKVIAKPKVKPDYKANRKPGNNAEEAPKITARSLRQKIIELSLQLPQFGDVVDRLELEGYGPATKVLISNVRDHAMTVLRVIMAEGLITEKQLARYRADAKDEQRRRFKRD